MQRIITYSDLQETDGNRKSGKGTGINLKQLHHGFFTNVQKVVNIPDTRTDATINNLIGQVNLGSDLQLLDETNIYDIKTYTKIKEGVTIVPYSDPQTAGATLSDSFKITNYIVYLRKLVTSGQPVKYVFKRIKIDVFFKNDKLYHRHLTNSQTAGSSVVPVTEFPPNTNIKTLYLKYISDNSSATKAISRAESIFKSTNTIFNISLTRDFVYFVDNGIVKKVDIDASADNTNASDVTPTIKYSKRVPFRGFIAIKENVPKEKYSSDETISNEIYLLNERQDSGSKTGVFKLEETYIRNSPGGELVSTTLIKAFGKKLIIYKDAVGGEIFLEAGASGNDDRVQSLKITGDFNIDTDELQLVNDGTPVFEIEKANNVFII